MLRGTAGLFLGTFPSVGRRGLRGVEGAYGRAMLFEDGGAPLIQSFFPRRPKLSSFRFFYKIQLAFFSYSAAVVPLLSLLDRRGRAPEEPGVEGRGDQEEQDEEEEEEEEETEGGGRGGAGAEGNRSRRTRSRVGGAGGGGAGGGGAPLPRRPSPLRTLSHPASLRRCNSLEAFEFPPPVSVVYDAGLEARTRLQRLACFSCRAFGQGKQYTLCFEEVCTPGVHRRRGRDRFETKEVKGYLDFQEVHDR